MDAQDVPKVHDPSFRGDMIIRFLPDSDQVLARMDRSTVQVFTNLADYLQLYGPCVDRVGYPDGKYLWHRSVGERPTYFEYRSLDIFALNDPYYSYEIKQLPQGCSIRTGINVPYFDLPGGARQVQFLAEDIVLSAIECLELGILTGRSE